MKENKHEDSIRELTNKLGGEIIKIGAPKTSLLNLLAPTVQSGCYVSILPSFYTKDDLDGRLIISLKNNDSTIHYELSIDTHCDSSDLAELNRDLQNGDLELIMKIDEEELPFTHLVKAHGYTFAVEIQ